MSPVRTRSPALISSSKLNKNGHLERVAVSFFEGLQLAIW
jgi:hypothetical protein